MLKIGDLRPRKCNEVMVFLGLGSGFSRHPKFLPIFCRFGLSRASSSRNLKESPGTGSIQNLDIFNSEVVSEIYGCNLKISNLGKCRQVEEARRLFDEMPRRDVVSYTTMITVHLRNRELLKAEKLLEEMPERTVVVESAMIDGYAKAGRIHDARRVFDGMSNRNVVSWTSLISGYLRAGQIDEARSLFDRMPVKNIVSWTTMLLGFARNGLIAEARDIFDRMPEKNVVSSTAMMKAYIEHGQVDDARKLFDEMPQRNVYSWNILISGYFIENRVTEAVKLFELMPHRNAVSWTTMVTGLARNGAIEDARKFFDQMPAKDIAAYNAMVTAYTQNGFIIEAGKLFSVMPDRNAVTWNAIIDGYVKEGLRAEAFKQFARMLRLSVRPNDTTFGTVIASFEAVIEITQVHALIILLGFELYTLTSNALITAYSRSGDMGSSQLAFGRAAAKDVVSWTAMICAYAIHGRVANALSLFANMIRSGATPDRITFLGVLWACSHSGLVEKGQKVFNSMKQGYHLEPTNEHYTCLVDLLARAGFVKEAKRVVRLIPPDQCDAPILAALLRANSHSEDAIRLVGGKLIELEPDVCGGYVQLANLYAAQGMWADVAQVRKKMRERKVKKLAGYSEIVVQKSRHVFYAGDRRHPQAKEIYAMLEEELLPPMKDINARLDN
ncbi:hypothetical protein H6P81_008798 [Aristolochia fimbriata]|uniref:Uncharacterized protein n=1 Tax=Aristolochia fimbriata TaxID=158543 RepID=A0AAV7ENL5_ARIFI|nr:hypothetical protein H6P81_008798 [Aristolochia fimbriata]